uniref:Uncharacterized protein n=1 Tax=Cacopsylla melanoneura TaxID=428564 RepID=A0A8D8W800_9HEMI
MKWRLGKVLNLEKLKRRTWINLKKRRRPGKLLHIKKLKREGRERRKRERRERRERSRGERGEEEREREKRGGRDTTTKAKLGLGAKRVGITSWSYSEHGGVSLAH